MLNCISCEHKHLSEESKECVECMAPYVKKLEEIKAKLVEPKQ